MGVKSQSQGQQVVRVWLDGCRVDEVKEAVDQIKSQLGQGKRIRYDYRDISVRAPVRCFDFKTRNIRVCVARGSIDFLYDDRYCWFTAVRLELTDSFGSLKGLAESLARERVRLCRGFFRLPKNMRVYDKESYDECVERCSAEIYQGLEADYEHILACEETECDILKLDPQERVIKAVKGVIDTRIDHRLTKTYIEGMGKYSVEYWVESHRIKDLGLTIRIITGEVCGNDIPCLDEDGSFEIYCIEPIYKH